MLRHEDCLKNSQDAIYTFKRLRASQSSVQGKSHCIWGPLSEFKVHRTIRKIHKKSKQRKYGTQKTLVVGIFQQLHLEKAYRLMS